MTDAIFVPHRPRWYARIGPKLTALWWVGLYAALGHIINLVVTRWLIL